jgi:hypothetical protein
LSRRRVKDEPAELRIVHLDVVAGTLDRSVAGPELKFVSLVGSEFYCGASPPEAPLWLTR